MSSRDEIGMILARRYSAFDLFCDRNPDFNGEWSDLPTAKQDQILAEYNDHERKMHRKRK